MGREKVFMGTIDEIVQRLQLLPRQLRDAAVSVVGRSKLESIRAEYVGPNGKLTAAMKEILTVPKNERGVVGRCANGVKAEIQTILDELETLLTQRENEERIGKAIDPTLSSSAISHGHRHPLSLVRDRVLEIFAKMGFAIVEATEVETEWACFDALNMPQTHPARDTMDTFFLAEEFSCGNVERHGNERYLLRTHCTSVQIRALLRRKLPLKVVAPGRVFRRDTVDATHSANFHQCDVVLVDRDVSVADLRNTIDFFLRSLFGNGVEMRYRPSFFPFTEPSYEVDIRVKNLGKLSNQWVEIFGCGLIHPNVFRAVNVDENCWSGQAWGIGLERTTMLLCGIDDVRQLYRNDMRFLQQF
jgi:phenylalanyl-tRNA synthetase alpha chain